MVKFIKCSRTFPPKIDDTQPLTLFNGRVFRFINILLIHSNQWIFLFIITYNDMNLGQNKLNLSLHTQF